MAILSICMPTFNRRDMAVQLIEKILTTGSDIEVCVHDDGSSDGTYEALQKIAAFDLRVKVSTGQNAGRAAALQRCVEASTAPYCMIFDDDDDINVGSLDIVVEDCWKPVSQDVAGYIYHMDIGGRSSTAFGVERSNLIALRADFRVSGDKKEVVRRSLLQAAMARRPKNCRRVPTSLYWSYISERHDIICRNLSVGTKNYISGGLTSKINVIKARDSAAMRDLHRQNCKNFLRCRYRSPVYAIRSVAGFLLYGYRSVAQRHV